MPSTKEQFDRSQVETMSTMDPKLLDDPAGALLSVLDDMSSMLALKRGDGSATVRDLEQLELDGYFDVENLEAPKLCVRAADDAARGYGLDVDGSAILLGCGGPHVELVVRESQVDLERHWGSGSDHASTSEPLAVAVARMWLSTFGPIVGQAPA